MALINCPECGKQISDKAEACPYCGLPSSYFVINKKEEASSVDYKNLSNILISFDSDYKKLCPWSDASFSGEPWPEDMTDAVVEVLESQKDNREQRRKERKDREKNNQ